MSEPQRQRWLALLVIFSVGCCVVIGLWPRAARPMPPPVPPAVDTASLPVLTPRESITFILGDDRGAKTHYYARAAFYYRMDPQDKTEYVVESCRSLSAVREYLVQHPPRNREPWGTINLVVHGNEWTGIAVPVLPGGAAQSGAAAMAAVADSGTVSALPDTTVDAHSEIILHGCAVGQNRELLVQLGRLFSTASTRPVVRGGRLFVLFDGDYYDSELVRTS
ncbi:MAG TPA: hypothetical protein PKM88_16420, partial [bacterium]|nr:hypothetical protein [bacterium]